MFHPMLFLINSSGNYIQDQSTNNCDGYDDCTDPEYPCDDDSSRQTFTMEDLAVGTYALELFSWNIYGPGNWSLTVICGMSI